MAQRGNSGGGGGRGRGQGGGQVADKVVDAVRVAVVEALVRVEIASALVAVRQLRISRVFPVLNKSARNAAVK